MAVVRGVVLISELLSIRLALGRGASLAYLSP